MLPKGHLRHPYGQVQRRQGQRQWAQKLDHPESQTRQSSFSESDQQLYSRELIRQTISDSTAPKYRSSGSSLARVSSGTLLLGRATNAWAVGAFADDVPTLSSLGRVVRTIDTATNALPPRMIRTYKAPVPPPKEGESMVDGGK
jgi:hypothetical protein